MVIDAYLHAVDQLTSSDDADGSAFVALLPTAPLRLASDIDGAVQLFEAQGSDSVISVTEALVPLQWYRRVDKQGVLRPFLDEGDGVSNR